MLLKCAGNNYILKQVETAKKEAGYIALPLSDKFAIVIYKLKLRQKGVSFKIDSSEPFFIEITKSFRVSNNPYILNIIEIISSE